MPRKSLYDCLWCWHSLNRLKFTAFDFNREVDCKATEHNDYHDCKLCGFQVVAIDYAYEFYDDKYVLDDRKNGLFEWHAFLYYYELGLAKFSLIRIL